jgi:hypothetical protein
VTAPSQGYFPFYIGCLDVGRACWVVLQTLLHWKLDGGQEVFAERHEFNLMLLMLIPTAAFVAAIFRLGHLPCLLDFHCGLHGVARQVQLLEINHGGCKHQRSLVCFVWIWFLLPLPKGFIEPWLG